MKTERNPMQELAEAIKKSVTETSARDHLQNARTALENATEHLRAAHKQLPGLLRPVIVNGLANELESIQRIIGGMLPGEVAEAGITLPKVRDVPERNLSTAAAAFPGV